MAVRVLDRLEVRDGAIDAAGGDDRDLAIEIDERLENRFLTSERLPGAGRVGRRRHRQLPLAVVAEARRLQNRGTADLRDRRAQIVLGSNRRKRRHRQPAIREKALLANAMLGDEERVPAGPHDGVLLGRRRRRGRDVLELEGDDVDASGEGADGVEVVVGGVDLDVGDLAGRACRLRGRACGRGSRGGGRRSRTCGPAGRRPARRWSRREDHGTLQIAIADCRLECGDIADHVSDARPTSAAISSRYACSFARRSGRDVAENGHRQQPGVGRARRRRSPPSRPARPSASARSTAANRAR